MVLCDELKSGLTRQFGGYCREPKLKTFIGDIEVLLQHTIFDLCVDLSSYSRS